MAKNISADKALFEDLNFGIYDTAKDESTVSGTIQSPSGNDRGNTKQDSGKKASSNSGKEQGNHTKKNQKSKEKPPVKTGFYISAKNFEALKLRVMRTAPGKRIESKLANDALEAFLKDELKVLSSIPDSIESNERLLQALKQFD